MPSKQQLPGANEKKDNTHTCVCVWLNTTLVATSFTGILKRMNYSSILISQVTHFFLIIEHVDKFTTDGSTTSTIQQSHFILEVDGLRSSSSDADDLCLHQASLIDFSEAYLSLSVHFITLFDLQTCVYTDV